MDDRELGQFHDLSVRIRGIELSIARLDEQGKVLPKVDSTLDQLNQRLMEIEKAVVQLNSLSALGELLKEQERKLTRLELAHTEFKSSVNTQRKVWASIAAAVGGAVGWLIQLLTGN